MGACWPILGRKVPVVPFGHFMKQSIDYPNLVFAQFCHVYSLGSGRAYRCTGASSLLLCGCPQTRHS
jgi:hypothetical protein